MGMSGFFQKAMRHLDWDGPFAREPESSGLYDMFCHELIDAGCEQKDVGASACYILSAILSKAIQNDDFAIKVMVDLHDMTGRPRPEWNYDLSSEGLYDGGERISIPFSGYDAQDSDGSLFFIWSGREGGDVAEFTATPTNLGPLVQKVGMKFGPRKWIEEQKEGWGSWPTSEAEGTEWTKSQAIKDILAGIAPTPATPPDGKS